MNEPIATETIVPTIAPEEDLEEKLATIEAEKAKAVEEKENYRKAYLKEAERRNEPANEDEDSRIKRLVDERLADSKLVEIAREQDELIRKALKENKELKLAHLNKSNEPPASLGSHSESSPVRDTAVTPDQMAFFKSKGWSDQDIERYKKNLQKGGGR